MSSSKSSITRDSHSKESKREDVGLGAGVCGGGAVHTFNTRFADSGTGSSPIHRIWQLPDQWSFHSGSLHPLLRSQLHLLASYWCPHVYWFIALKCGSAFDGTPITCNKSAVFFSFFFFKVNVFNLILVENLCT